MVSTPPIPNPSAASSTVQPQRLQPVTDRQFGDIDPDRRAPIRLIPAERHPDDVVSPVVRQRWTRADCQPAGHHQRGKTPDHALPCSCHAQLSTLTGSTPAWVRIVLICARCSVAWLITCVITTATGNSYG